MEDNSNKPPFPPKGNAVVNFFKEIISIVLISLVIVIPVRYYLIQPFIVKGASMEPNFHNGEYLIINEIEYRFESPERGDVIVFKYPKNPNEYYIKRIIGLPGEKVQIKGGQVTIFDKNNLSGFALEEDKYLPGGRVTRGDVSIVLGEDEYFVLGDNRSASSDSRVWGVLPKQNIIGKSWIRAFPFSRFAIFQQ